MLDLLLFGQKTAPNFFWDARSGVLPAGSTFTRGSAGWYFNSSGVLTQASSNVARFSYDPSNVGTAWGYLAEMQSTNLVSWSDDFTQTFWNGSIGVTRTYDGTRSTITENSATSNHQADMNANIGGLTASSVYGISYLVQNVSGTRWVVLNDGTSYIGFQPSSGTLGNIGGTAYSNVSVRTLANGEYRIQARYTASSTSADPFCFSLQTANPSSATQSRAGDGTSAVAIRVAQFETAGVGVTAPIPTAGSTVTRSQDILSLPLTSLPGWNASKGGVLVAAYRTHTIKPASPGYDARALTLDDGSNNNLVSVIAQYAGGSSRRSFVTSGGSTQADLNAGTFPSVFTRTKQAVSWSTSRDVLAADGALLIGVSGSLLLPVGPTTLHIGSDQGGGQQLNGTIESIAYYAGARSDAFVQGVSR